jgi:hypothetical protein
MLALVDLVKRGDESELPGATAPGEPPATQGLPVLRWLLGRCAPAQGAAAALIASVTALHDRTAAGETIEPGTWRALRLTILDVVDTAEGEQRALAQVAEAAAWPIEGASSLLVDVFSAVVTLLHLRRNTELGWTRADQQSAEEHLRAIHDELSQEGTPVDRRRIPVLFSARQPELERRFVEQLNAANATYAALAGEVLIQIRAALQPR